MLTRYQIDALNRRGIILYNVAKTIGLSEARVYRLLKGRAVPRLGELEALAAALGLTVADISESTRPEKRNPRTAVPVRG